MRTLCAPTSEILCFGCCPPIRPAHYDHLDYVTSLKREFCDNRHRFLQHGPNQRPIVGFSCWALGYLDAAGRRIGCLLHPEQHQGEDLRSATGYADKCRRERCLPASAFAALSSVAQKYWLEPASGLCSFYYSSTRANPLFHILLWGAEILEPLCREASRFGWTATELLWKAPILSDRNWSPRGHRYLVRMIWSTDPSSLTQNAGLLENHCRKFWDRVRALPGSQPCSEDAPQAAYLHQLGLSADYVDFLRIALGWHRATWECARTLQLEIEQMAAATDRPDGDGV
jgi:hypothetical protein